MEGRDREAVRGREKCEAMKGMPQCAWLGIGFAVLPPPSHLSALGGGGGGVGV
jgi:hypothetical protein